MNIQSGINQALGSLGVASAIYQKAQANKMPKMPSQPKQVSQNVKQEQNEKMDVAWSLKHKRAISQLKSDIRRSNKSLGKEGVQAVLDSLKGGKKDGK